MENYLVPRKFLNNAKGKGKPFGGGKSNSNNGKPKFFYSKTGARPYNFKEGNPESVSNSPSENGQKWITYEAGRVCELPYHPHQFKLIDGDSRNRCITFQLISANTVQVYSPGGAILDDEKIEVLKNHQGTQGEKCWYIPYGNHKACIREFTDKFSNYILKDIPNFVHRAMSNDPHTSKAKTHEMIFSSEKYALVKHCYEGWESEIPLERLNPDFVAKLYDFQKDGVNFGIRSFGRILFADEMGIGKTIQGLGVALAYRYKWPLLIITPSCLRYNWFDEILKFYPFVPKEKILIINTCKFTLTEEIKGKEIVLLSYDLCPRYISEMSKVNFQVVIADEAHYLKNSLAKRTNLLVPFMKRIRHVILLTGTPALARPKELYSICTILRPDVFTFFKEFGFRYCSPKKSTFANIVDFDGASNSRELNFMLSKFMIRRHKVDVLKELPPKRRQIIHIPVEASLIKDIQDFLKENGSTTIEDLAEALVTQNPSSVSMKEVVGQASNQKKMRLWEAFTKCYSLTGKSKLKGIKEYLRTILENNTKFIVFAHHIEVLNAIELDLNSIGVTSVKIDGSVRADLRHERVNQFQSLPNVKVALLSLTASSVGITLTASSNIIFAEMHWTPAVMLQAEDRAHRIGQEASVNIHYLYGQSSLDDVLLKKLSEKIMIVSEVIDGQKRDMALENKLDFKALQEESKKVTGADILSYFDEIPAKEALRKKKAEEEEEEEEFVPVIDNFEDGGEPEKKVKSDESSNSEISGMKRILPIRKFDFQKFYSKLKIKAEKDAIFISDSE